MRQDRFEKFPAESRNKIAQNEAYT